MAVLFLYGMLAYAGLRVARAAKGAYAKLLAGRPHLPDPQPGVPERLRRARAGAADRRAAALHLLRSDDLTVAAGQHGVCCSTWPPGQCPSARRGGSRRHGPTIVIAAGGTAGHVVPALAVADALAG